MPKVGLSLGFSFEKLFNIASDPSKLRVFGCLRFPWLRHYSSHKLDPNPVLMSFLVTISIKVPFSVLTLPSKKIFVSRHVKFVENVFSFVSLYLHHMGNKHNLYTPRFIVSLVQLSGSASLPHTHTAELTRIAPFITNTPLVLPSSCFSPTHTLELT